MKNYKIITALALGSLLATSALNAQESPRKHKRPEGAPGGEQGPGPRGPQIRERFEKIAEELNLTEDQKTQLREFVKSNAGKREELKDATPEDRMAAAKQMRTAFDAKMKEILTGEQYAKWVELRPAPGAKKPAGPGGPGGERRHPKGPKPADKD